MVENGEKTQTHDIKFEFLRNQRSGVRIPLDAPSEQKELAFSHCILKLV